MFILKTTDGTHTGDTREDVLRTIAEYCVDDNDMLPQIKEASYFNEETEEETEIDREGLKLIDYDLKAYYAAYWDAVGATKEIRGW